MLRGATSVLKYNRQTYSSKAKPLPLQFTLLIVLVFKIQRHTFPAGLPSVHHVLTEDASINDLRQTDFLDFYIILNTPNLQPNCRQECFFKEKEKKYLTKCDLNCTKSN